MQNLNIVLVEDGVKPVRATEGSTGLDCFQRDGYFKLSDSGVLQIVYKIGFKQEIPHGYTAYLYPRSSHSKTLLRMANSVGVLDSDWRGESLAIYDLISPNDDGSASAAREFIVTWFSGESSKGNSKPSIVNFIESVYSFYADDAKRSETIISEIDKYIPILKHKAVCQMIIRKDEVDFDINIVDSLSETARNEGGFGSTNKK